MSLKNIFVIVLIMFSLTQISCSKPKKVKSFVTYITVNYNSQPVSSDIAYIFRNPITELTGRNPIFSEDQLVIDFVEDQTWRDYCCCNLGPDGAQNRISGNLGCYEFGGEFEESELVYLTFLGDRLDNGDFEVRISEPISLERKGERFLTINF